MRLKFAHFVTFGLLLAAGQNAYAIDCKEFLLAPTENGCMTSPVTLSWVAIGGGWTSVLYMANQPGVGQIQATFWLHSANAPNNGYDVPSMAAYVVDNKYLPLGTIRSVPSVGYLLQPGDSVQVTFLHGDDPNVNYNGSVSVSFFASTPEALRGVILQPSLQYHYTGGFQGSVTALIPAPVWRGQLVSAPDGSQSYSIAMYNPGDASVIVEGDLVDQAGHPVATTTWTIPSGNTRAAVLSSEPTPDTGSGILGGFGSKMFPGGQTFTGTLTLKVISPTGGVISPIALQANTMPGPNGTTVYSMSSAYLQGFAQ